MMLDSRSYWLKDDYRVDFKNLIGRVGRIEFNMFGNIFLISDSNTNEKYIKAIEREVEDQKLSVDYYLSESKKKEIVDALVQGKTVIEKKSSETYDQYNFSRYVLNILLKDIISGQRGKFHKLFDKYLTVEMLDEIYSQHKDKIVVKDNKIVTIKNSLLKCPKVAEEVQRVKYNYRDLFNEKK